MIYDLEEDSEYFYLIEEYLQGTSLCSLIKSQGTLQEADAVRYGMQICGLVEYMHSACRIPILYLDLQPNNLIICDGTVKLIDFDHAARWPDANLERQRYGTVGCAAPEQYTSDRMLDQRTDIYAIGAVLRFMLDGTLRQGADGTDPASVPLRRIIRKCMDPDMDKRYRTAKETGDALRTLCVRETAVNQNHDSYPSLIIYLAAMRPGAGVTHLAFGLLHFLTVQGHEALYEEHNHSRAVRTLALQAGARPDAYGIYKVRGCHMKPWYGPAVRLAGPLGYQIVLKDYGTDWKQLAADSADARGILVAVAVSSLWEREYADQMAGSVKMMYSPGDDPKTVIVFRGRTSLPRISPCVNRAARAWDWAGLLKQAMVFASPEYDDPFRQQKETEAFFRSIWNAVSGGVSQNGKKGWFKGWHMVKKAFLNAAKALQRDAGLSELPEQDAGRE